MPRNDFLLKLKMYGYGLVWINIMAVTYTITSIQFGSINISNSFKLHDEESKIITGRLRVEQRTM